jgi:protein SCO1/2
MRIVLLFLVLLSACSRKNIANEYPAEMSTIAVPGQGLPYIVGEDLRPEWNLENGPKPRELMNFKMRDQEGREVSREQLRGKVAIVSFFYSKCPGICPITTKNLRVVQEKLAGNGKVVMLSFSLTPENDSPKVLHEYAEANHVDKKHWHLLTGAREEIYQLARESFSADTISARENALKKLNKEDFLHSENVFLIDGEFKLRGVYAGMMPSSLESMVKDAEALSR